MTSSQSIRIGFCLLSIIMICACTTMEPLATTNPDWIAREVESGDKVRIATTAGDTVRMKVDAVTESGLQGKDEFVAFGDIDSISVRRPDDDANDTLKFAVGAVALATVFVAEAIAQGLATY